MTCKRAAMNRPKKKIFLFIQQLFSNSVLKWKKPEQD
jgi:hypothetical protein